ncbi:alpha/beta fold hydrolase [Thiocystis violacea]|uniref:alpha/beta fold hydrolase n=1 Tax=Thiocystis violacea TaxID=13725 RepID=UPI0019038F2E|nr:alpha/beta fold hydrolase [Thiocystis violacea]MBK1719513.1 alpha/beta hydrolase [Thiocystis violacea]
MSSVVKDQSHSSDALRAPREVFTTSDGWRLSYYADSSHQGRPLVLIHSINAASSSFEMRPLFEHYRQSRPVYSLDLPGFGHSERRETGYSPERYAQAIAEFLDTVVREPADLIALSLSAEFAARAARDAPERFASLVLISPTGFGSQSLPRPSAARLISGLVKRPVLSQRIYDLVASRPSIRYFLGRSFVGRIPDEMVAYAHATSHQPGARHAPLTFLSTGLFSAEPMDRLYAKLGNLPVLAIADQDPYIDFARLPAFVAAHPSWRMLALAPHRGLPHWEKPGETFTALDDFWASGRLRNAA